MAEFWQEFRKKVLDRKTSADVAQMVYHKVASTGVAGPAIIKPRSTWPSSPSSRRISRTTWSACWRPPTRAGVP